MEGLDRGRLVGRRLDGKVSIVTGAARGIGEAYARALAGEGASVVVADLDGPGAAAVAKDITAGGGTAVDVAVDVSDPASTEALAAATHGRSIRRMELR